MARLLKTSFFLATSIVGHAYAERCDFNLRIPSMGTVFEIQWVDVCHSKRKDSLSVAVKTRLDQMEAAMSLYQSESEISRLNRTGRIKNPNDDLRKVVELSLQNAPLTDGYFDITVLPILNLIKTEFRDKHRPPLEGQLEALRQKVGFNNVILAADEIHFQKSGMAVTLDGIAKGYAVDVISDQLIRDGFNDFIVNFSGNMRIKGHHADGRPWSLALEDPVNKKLVRFEISEGSMASSGVDFASYSEDMEWHHLINPKTLRPANVLVGTTIVGPSAVICDVLSTATFVMGAEGAQNILRKNYPDYQYWFVNKKHHIWSNLKLTLN